MSTITELVNQGKAYRVVAILDEKSVELEATLSEYDAVEVQRKQAAAERAQYGESDWSIRAYDETIADLNKRSAALLDVLVAILRTEG